MYALVRNTLSVLQKLLCDYLLSVLFYIWFLHAKAIYHRVHSIEFLFLSAKFNKAVLCEWVLFPVLLPAKARNESTRKNLNANKVAWKIKIIKHDSACFRNGEKNVSFRWRALPRKPRSIYLSRIKNRYTKYFPPRSWGFFFPFLKMKMRMNDMDG